MVSKFLQSPTKNMLAEQFPYFFCIFSYILSPNFSKSGLNNLLVFTKVRAQQFPNHVEESG